VHGPQLSERQLGLLRAYLGELALWNRRINLTAVPERDWWLRHVEGSLSLLAVAAPPAAGSVVDVGSGAGLPGIVVAVARPDMRVALVEADRRKAAFLIHVAGTLALDNVRVEATRAEAAGHDPRLRETFDVALSRAAAPAERLVELALPLLHVGGRLVAAVADPPGAAARAGQSAQTFGGGRPRVLKGAIEVVKERPTPAELPRRSRRAGR